MIEAHEGKESAKNAAGLMRAMDNGHTPAGSNLEVLEMQMYMLPRDKFELIPNGTRFADSGGVSTFLKGQDDSVFLKNQPKTDMSGKAFTGFVVGFYDGLPDTLRQDAKAVGKVSGHRKTWDAAVNRRPRE